MMKRLSAVFNLDLKPYMRTNQKTTQYTTLQCSFRTKKNERPTKVKLSLKTTLNYSLLTDKPKYEYVRSHKLIGDNMIDNVVYGDYWWS